MTLSRHQIEIANEQATLVVDEALFIRAVQTVLEGEGIAACEISVALVEEPAMHALNKQYLDHDYPTDVLSFLLDETESPAGRVLEGQIIASAGYAIQHAAEYGWSPVEELLLYVIHGTLHLTGYDDHADEDREQMRRAERKYLAQLGIVKN